MIRAFVEFRYNVNDLRIVVFMGPSDRWREIGVVYMVPSFNMTMPSLPLSAACSTLDISPFGFYVMTAVLPTLTTMFPSPSNATPFGIVIGPLSANTDEAPSGVTLYMSSGFRVLEA